MCGPASSQDAYEISLYTAKINSEHPYNLLQLHFIKMMAHFMFLSIQAVSSQIFSGYNLQDDVRLSDQLPSLWLHLASDIQLITTVPKTRVISL